MDGAFKVAVIDYGMGNLRSIENAIHHIGSVHVEVSSDPKVIAGADCLVLPGVGAFPDAMSNLESKGLSELLYDKVISRRTPILGICLGMQLLFEHSSEGGGHIGLGWIPGHVERMDLAPSYRVPHVGWNDLIICENSSLFNGVGEDKNFYFVHSYHAVCEERYILAKFEYYRYMTAVVRHQNIIGMQFHPEKSQSNGIHLLKNFLGFAKETTGA